MTDVGWLENRRKRREAEIRYNKEFLGPLARAVESAIKGGEPKTVEEIFPDGIPPAAFQHPFETEDDVERHRRQIRGEEPLG